VDSKWFVDVFEEDNIRFTTKEDLEIFINIVNKNKK
jgi:2-C-methyl-D-erythritol 4-phosphate cytidylyltransferase